MNSFSIAQLEQFSGIKAHTIRIWEQRYSALTPARSKGNTRTYDGAQLKRLLNIVSLMEADYKISEICEMTNKEILKITEAQLTNHQTKEGTPDYFVSQIIAAGISFDEIHFEKIFSNCLLRFGLKDTYIKVIYPMLVRMGLMWMNEKLPPAQEHFISNLIRQKLFSSIDSLPPAKNEKNKWLLFLPEGEFHEIGLLFSNYLIRQSGKKVIFLGCNIPVDTLSLAVKETSSSHILFFMAHQSIPKQAQQYLSEIKGVFKRSKIHLAGNEKLISQLKLGKEIDWLRSVTDLEKMLTG